jgi:DNA-binding transcriptional LysR family regulator
MNPVESRPLRYFVAVAEELSFARAAERLAISAPALSRAIAQLEAQMGVRLLDRSTRSVALTDAGQLLLDQGKIALHALDGAVRRAQRAAESQDKLVLALKADLDGGLLERAIEAYEHEHPGVPLEVQLCGWGEQAELLRNGRADVALVYQPHERIDERDLDFDIVQEEPQVVALPAEHPLSAAPTVGVGELEAEYECVPQTVIWRPRRDALAHRALPRIGDMSRLLKLVELGKLVALLPASVAESFARPRVAYRPVLDAAPAALAVAWPRSSRSLAAAAFVRAVTQVVAAQRPDRGSLSLAGTP